MKKNVFLPESLKNQVFSLQRKHSLTSFKRLFTFSFWWSNITLFFFTAQAIAEKDTAWMPVIVLAFLSSTMFYFIKRNHEAIFEKAKNSIFHGALIVFVLSMLPLLYFIFVSYSPFSHVAGLHTVTGIVYGLFIGLYYFLPSWKMTLVASLISISFLITHYIIGFGWAWSFGEFSGNINIFYVLQLLVESLFFIGFFSLNNKHKEKIGSELKSIFLKKIITSPHLKMMDINGKIEYGDYKIKVKVIPSHDIGGADVVVVERFNEDIFVCIGDVIGHGLEVSAGSFIVSSAVRSLILSGASPQVIFDSVNKILTRVDDNEGGEIFMQLIVLKSGGIVDIYGHPAGETFLNRKPILELMLLILGKDKNAIENNIDLFQPLQIRLDIGDTIFTATDGWIMKDKADDKSYVRIKYK